MRIPRLVVAGLVVGVALGAGAVPPDKSSVVPQTIEIDGCVQPSDACTGDVIETLELAVDGKTQKLAIEKMRVIGGTRMWSSVLDDVRGRPLRVVGPDELVEQVVPGKRLSVRGTLRSGTFILFLQGVDELE